MRNNRPPLFFCLALFSLPALISPAPLFAQVQEQTKKDDVSVIMALPYLQGYVKAPDVTGVTRYSRAEAYPGLTLWTSGHTGYAGLIDMKGHILHEWAYPLERIWPDLAQEKTAPFWENVYLYENGDLLAIYNRGGMIKLDKDSHLIWAYKCRAHHDIALDEQGNIYTLTEDLEELKEDIQVLDNSILVLSPQGERLAKMSILRLMQQSDDPNVQLYFKRVLTIALNGGEDIFHTNTLEIFDDPPPGQSAEIYAKGNILISMLTISSIAVIDPREPAMIWILGPKIWFEGQHNPTLLDNGNLLIFDNHYLGSKEQSRILEFNPLTLQAVWQYMPDGFYTDTHGTNVPLPNGNVLIIESNTGRIFEVTRDKKIVWEFLNPHTTGENNDLIAAVFAAYRIEPDYVSSWPP